jgi:phage terminase small subunit
MNTENKRPPTGLGPHGRALWRDTVARYTLTPTEIEVLHTLCVTGDQLIRVDLALKQAHVTSTGSQGQLVGHPLLAEHRAHAETLRRLSRQLNLPDTASAPRKTKTNPNRIAHLRRQDGA